MFCPRCGKQLSDGANFCTGCGEKLNLNYEAERPVQKEDSFANEDIRYEQQYADEQPDAYFDENYDDVYDEYYDEEPAPRSGNKKLFIILGIVIAAAVAAVLCVYFFVIRGGSSGTLESAVEKTSTTLMERSDVTAFLGKAKEEGKFGVTVKADNIGQMLSSINSYLSYINISGEITAAGDKDGNAYVYVSADALGQDINAGIYRSEDDAEIVVSAPSILKDNYGISLKSIEDDFDDSIFAPDSDTEYSIDENTYDQIKSAIAMASEANSAVSPQIFKDYWNDLRNNEDTRLEFEKTRDTVDVGDAEVKCDVYTTEFDEDKLVDIIDFTEEWLEDNENLEQIFDTISRMSGGYSASSLTDSLDQLSKNLGNVSLDGSLECDVYKGSLVRAAGTLKVEGQKIKFEITTGSDPTKTDEIKASFGTPDGSFDLTADLSKMDENEINLTVESEEANIYFDFGFKYDEEDKEFEAFAKNEYRDFRLTGDMDVTDNEITVGNLKFSRNEEEVLNLKGIEITFNRNPEIHSMKDDFKDGYTNILKLKEDEIEDLAEEAQEAVYSLAG